MAFSVTSKEGKVAGVALSQGIGKSKGIVFAEVGPKTIHVSVSINVGQKCQGEPGVGGEEFGSLP